MDRNYLSSYQDPEGTLNDRLAPRTDKRLGMLKLGRLVDGKTVLDIGCNNGYFVRKALELGATRAVGVDRSDCIVGARELAKGTNAEFWQVNADSKEFRRFCPKFDTVFLLSVITHLRDKEEFLDWLDRIVGTYLVFESNHGERNKAHIDLVKKHLHFQSELYLGASDIPEKPHYLWILKRVNHEERYPNIQALPITFIPINRITRMDPDILLDQKTTYPVTSDKHKALIADIKLRGIRENLLVKTRKDGTYGIMSGGHRFLAMKALGYKEFPCKIVPYHLLHPGKKQ